MHRMCQRWLGFPQAVGFCIIGSSGDSRGPTRAERYRSGRNGRASKACCPKGHVGSNPTLSATNYAPLGLRSVLPNSTLAASRVLPAVQWFASRPEARHSSFVPVLTRRHFQVRKMCTNIGRGWWQQSDGDRSCDRKRRRYFCRTLRGRSSGVSRPS